MTLAVSEQAWQRQVVDLAQLLGWLCYHTYDSRRSNPGFPDLVLVRDRVVYAELKTDTGRITRQQRQWLAALSDAGAEAHVWRPRDIKRVQRVLTRQVPGWKPPIVREVVTVGGRL